MQTSHHPIRTTILLGLICAMAFIPVSWILSYMTSGSNAICSTLWLFTSAYAFLLRRWSRKASLACVFPLVILFTTIFLVESTNFFFLLSLVVIGWIRSGIYFQKPAGRRLMTETLLGFAIGIQVIAFEPHSAFGWSLGVWMFFLVQAIYFVLNESTGASNENRFELDPFEKAYRHAETILDSEKTVLYSNQNL